MHHEPADPAARHAAVAELLAWYVNGTLAPAERALVERHLDGCADCREQVAFWGQLSPALAEVAVAPVPHPAQLRALLARLDAAPAGEPDVEASAGRVASPRATRWLLLGQAAAIVALAATLLVAVRRAPEAGFHTLTAAAEASASARLRVVFDERASERELRALLVPLGASFVGGPSPLGVYTLELPADAELAATIAALRAQPLVRFVEPLAGDGGELP